MFANSAFGRISLALFSLVCAGEDFRRQSVPRFFFGTLFVAELLFYLQRFIGGAHMPSREIPYSLLLSLPILAFSLLTREALGLGDAFFLLTFGLGAGFQRLLLVLTLGFLAAALFSLCLLCLRYDKLRSIGTRRLPLLPFLLPPALGSLFFLHGGPS